MKGQSEGLPALPSFPPPACRECAACRGGGRRAGASALRLVSSPAVASVQRGREGASPPPPPPRRHHRCHRRVAKRGRGRVLGSPRPGGEGGNAGAVVLAYRSRLLRLWDIGAGLREACVGRGGGMPYPGRWGGRERLTHLPGVEAGGSRQTRLPLRHPALSGGLAAAIPVWEQRLLPPALRCGLPRCGGRWPTCFATSVPRKR